MYSGTFLQQPGCPPDCSSGAFATTSGRRSGCEGLTAAAKCGNLTGGKYWQVFPDLSLFAVSWDRTRILQMHGRCQEENEYALELIFLVEGDSLPGNLSAVTSLVAFSQCFSLQRALLIQQLENDAGYLGLGCCRLPWQNTRTRCNRSAYVVPALPGHVSRCCPKSELLSCKAYKTAESHLSLQQCGFCYVYCHCGWPGDLGKQQIRNLNIVLCALKGIFYVIWKLWVYGFVSDTEEGQVTEITRKRSECTELICLAIQVHCHS